MHLIKLLSLLLFVSLTAESLSAQRVFFHRQRTCNKFCLSGKYDYGQDKRTASVSVVAKADEARASNITGSNFEKRFHIPVSGLSTDRVTLKNVGVHINDNGEVKITGKLDHNGGPDGGLRGSNVRVSVKAYAGVQNAENIDDAIVVWKLEQNTWCYKDRIKDVSIDRPSERREMFKRVFPKITHVEIELEHEIDR